MYSSLDFKTDINTRNNVQHNAAVRADCKRDVLGFFRAGTDVTRLSAVLLQFGAGSEQVLLGAGRVKIQNIFPCRPLRCRTPILLIQVLSFPKLPSA
jgi:hypothetical protein